MKRDKVWHVVGVFALLVIGVAGNWCLVNLVDHGMKQATRKALANPKPGPFDEAVAKSIGVPVPKKANPFVIPPHRPPIRELNLLD